MSVNNKLRVLIPAWSFYPSQEGGPSNALYWLATGLAKTGYQVRVVATNRCIKPGIVAVNAWSFLNGFEVIYSTIDLRSSFLNEELEKCDVLIANGVCSLSNFKLNKRAIRMGKKVILSPRGELLDSAVFHKGLVHGLIKGVMFFFMRLAYGKKVLYHATSPEEVESVKKYMGKSARIVLIPNYMILPDRVTPDAVSFDYLLYIGRLNQIKNLDIILSGLAESRAFINGPYVFKVAGERHGEYYESLTKQADELGISSKVDFLGLVTGHEKDSLYANAKCLLLLSKSENFGNVIIEALSQGTPAIASKGTPWQLLDKKGAGWWIDAKPKEVAKTVDELLSLSEDDYLTMREASYAYSREFDIFTNIEKWSQIVEN